MDWKMLARSDKYYVKLFEDETNLRAYILLDCSESMGFRSGEISKLDYGAFLAASLSYLLIRQNDAVGTLLFDSDIRTYVPPRAHPSQFRRVLETLEEQLERAPAIDEWEYDPEHREVHRRPDEHRQCLWRSRRCGARTRPAGARHGNRRAGVRP